MQKRLKFPDCGMSILYLLQEQVREDTNVLWLFRLPAPQHNALFSYKVTIYITCKATNYLQTKVP